jgi:beta-glucosidase
MLFIRDRVATISRPVMELKKWQKFKLNPNESKTIQFKLTSADLAYYNQEGQAVIEPGWFDIMVGPHAKEVQQQSFKLLKG